MLYLHRLTRQNIKGLRGEITDLRNRMGRLEERMARLEGTLDVLRQFFVRNGRGTAAWARRHPCRRLGPAIF